MMWSRFSKSLPWLVLAIGLAATYYLQHAAFNVARHIQREDFNYQAGEITRSIEQRLGAYEQVLHGVRGLYSSSAKVDRDEFHNYVADLRLEHQHAGIQGIGFSLIIAPQEKARHIQAIRKEGFPNYTLRPEGERDLYAPVIYIEPFTGRNLRALGYDVYSEAVRRAAMEQARDLDSPVMSGKIMLVQEIAQNVQAGFIVYLPVYRNGIPHKTLAERRANIVGWISAVFRMNDLMVGILGEQINNIDLEIWDGESTSLETLMYDNDGVFSPSLANPSLYNSTQHMAVIGHTWTVKLLSLPSIAANLDTGQVTVIRLTGVLVSLLLSLLVWQLASGRTRALNLAQ